MKAVLRTCLAWALLTGALGWGGPDGTAGPVGLGAETRVITDMELYNTVYRGGEDWHYLGSGSASLGLVSPRDPHVSAQVELEFFPLDLYGAESASGGEGDGASPADDDSEGSLGEYSDFHLKKAWVKTRFPGFRLTVGKTRLAWGQGMVFNAGDLLFGSLNPALDLTARELRSDTAWLTALNIPFGPFAFAEAVVLPPSLGLPGSVDTEGGVKEISRSSLGGRLYVLAGSLKVEGGYLYKGERKVSGDLPGHRPYLALQGNIGPDWYLAASGSFATDEQIKEQGAEEDWEKTLTVSGGLFHLQEINRNNSLSLRLEALVFPGLRWEEKGSRSTVYGLYLYPELTWTGGAVTAALQSVVSPLDGSAMITAGASWKIYQGLTLLGYLTLLSGEEDDTFAWDRGDLYEDGSDQLNGVSLMCGLRYTF